MGAETAIAGDGGRGMHTEEEVVFGGDGHGVAHEDGGIDDEGGGHLAGDTINAGSVPIILTLPTPVPHPLCPSGSSGACHASSGPLALRFAVPW